MPNRGTDSEEAAEAAEATEVTKVADMVDAPRSDASGAQAVDEKRAYLRMVPAWKPAAVGLLVLAVSRALLGGATDSSEDPEEREELPVSFVAPPPETPQVHSLSLAAFQDETVAVREAQGLSGRRTDLLFTTVPVLVSGRVFHRILAGPATDSAAAEELRTSLGETLSDEDSSVWVVRATPVVFDLGNYGSREVSDRKADKLAVTGLAPSDGLSFRVYAGAYADSAGASVAHAQFMQ